MGGRVFVDNQRSYYFDPFSRQKKICDLAWPKNIDVVGEIRKCWFELPRRSHLTLRRPYSGKLELYEP
jgi:hypothetical protein